MYIYIFTTHILDLRRRGEILRVARAKGTVVFSLLPLWDVFRSRR